MYQPIKSPWVLPVLIIALAVFSVPPASAQLFQPGGQGSSNMKMVAHIPTGGPFNANDIDIEQELSRPYVYVSGRSALGVYIIDIKEPSRAKMIWRWVIEQPALHQGRALNPIYLKANGRYFLTEAFQFMKGGPDADLGAVVWDVTGLPDTAKIREVARIRAPEAPGGFHESFGYKHSDGRSLLFTTSTEPYARVYDIAKVASGTIELAGKVPNPVSTAPGSTSMRGYHDFYVGFDPVSKQDRFFGAGGGGYYVYDVTNLADPKLIASATGVAGLANGHTFTPDPTGRYAVLESEYQYAPLRIVDLQPAYDGTVKTVSRPIGAWTPRWNGLAHNHQVRWPYVFVSGYEDGVQVFNMMDPTNPYTVAYYHTYDGPLDINKSNPMGDPHGGTLQERSVDNGSFGIAVRNTDGLIVTADMYTGFWAFHMDGFDGWNGHQWGVPNQSAAQDWDNGPEGAPKPQKVS